MAGVWSPDSCRGCSSGSCTCGSCASGDPGTWSDPSLLNQRLSEDWSRHTLQQKWTSMWNSEEKEEEEEEEEDRPLVFLCSRCRRPLGDSLSWVTSQEDSNSILLRCVSCNVSVDKEQILSKRENENGCVLETLYCTGCSLNLGYKYRCTPSNLDYKRDLFCLSVEAIERFLEYSEKTGISKLVMKEVPLVFWKSRNAKFNYFCFFEFGSSEKQIVSEDKEVFNLESRIEIENSLKQMEDVLKALQTKLWEVESKLSSCKS